MDIRVLGRNGLPTSAIGFGAMGLSQGYGATDDDESLRTIHSAMDAGVSLFDTAMSYGQGHNEELVGRAIRASGVDRGDLQVASKFGIVRGAAGVELDGEPSRVAQYCDGSLRRLGLDHLDLYYLHRVDPTVPLAETVGAMAELVAAGKVAHLGVSEVTADQLGTAHAVYPIAAVQFEWSLMWRQPENDVVPAARRLGIGLVPYSPLGRGLLTHTLTAQTIGESAFRTSDPRFTGSHLADNTAEVDRLADFARGRGVTAGQVALAWLMAQGDDVVPIPGSRRSERAVENAEAAALVAAGGALADIASAIPNFDWTGDRHSFAVPVTGRPA